MEKFEDVFRRLTLSIPRKKKKSDDAGKTENEKAQKPSEIPSSSVRTSRPANFKDANETNTKKRNLSPPLHAVNSKKIRDSTSEQLPSWKSSLKMSNFSSRKENLPISSDESVQKQKKRDISTKNGGKSNKSAVSGADFDEDSPLTRNACSYAEEDDLLASKITTNPPLITHTQLESAKKQRRSCKITVKPESLEPFAPPPISSFRELTEDEFYSVIDAFKAAKNPKASKRVAATHTHRPWQWLIDNIENSMKIASPTPIQMQAIPAMLADFSVVGCAPTGSGKTLAYLVPLLMKMKAPSKEFARSLILSPTRELAQQIKRHFDLLIGGKKFRCKVIDKLVGSTSLKSSAATHMRLDLAVSTPLLLLQLCRKEQIRLDACRYLVLDEADKLFDMGFLPQVDEIMNFCSNPALQLHLFSATLSDAVFKLADTVMQNSLRISIGLTNSAASTIEQSLLFVTNEEGKLSTLLQLVHEGKIVPPTLIFVENKKRAVELFNELIFDGIFVDVIHSVRTKAQRDAVVEAFRSGKIWVLICTDLMARGVDFKGVQLVINYDFPRTAAEYIHRIGRTGRAGRNGKAITLFTLKDVPFISIVTNVMKQSGCEVPEWLSDASKLKGKERRKQRDKLKRKRISTTSGYDLARRAKKQQIMSKNEVKKASESS